MDDTKFELWKKHLTMVLNQSSRSIRPKKVQLMVYFIEYVMNDKSWMLRLSNTNMVNLYKASLGRADHLYEYKSLCPEKYILRLDKILAEEYLYAHGGAIYNDKLWEVIKAYRHIFVRYVDKKYILDCLPDCLADIVVEYMV